MRSALPWWMNSSSSPWVTHQEIHLLIHAPCTWILQSALLQKMRGTAQGLSGWLFPQRKIKKREDVNRPPTPTNLGVLVMKVSSRAEESLRPASPLINCLFGKSCACLSTHPLDEGNGSIYASSNTPRRIWSSSIDSNSALKLPSPK